MFQKQKETILSLVKAMYKNKGCVTYAESLYFIRLSAFLLYFDFRLTSVH